MDTDKNYKRLYLEKENEVKELKKELQSKKNNIEKDKVKIAKYYDDCKRKDNTIDDLKLEIRNISNIIIDKDNIIKEKDLKIKELSSMEIKFNTLVSNNNNLRKQIKDQQSKIATFKENNKKAIITDKQDTLEKEIERESKLLNEISGLKNNNVKLKNIIDDILSEKDKLFNSKRLYKSILYIIDLLNYELSMNNVDSYQNIFTLSNRVKLLLERKRSYKNNDLDINIETSNITIWGYTFEEDNKIKFIDLDGKCYSIIELGDFIRIDTPAKAMFVDEETVKIESFYYEHIPKIFDDIKKSKKGNIPKEANDIQNQEDEIIPIGSYRVMIITGRNAKHYKNYLDMYGLKVSTFNPFEENLNMINEKAKSQDIVIVMKNAISHAVMDIIDIKDKKFQVIGRDNKKYLVARIRYYLINYVY